MPPALASLGGYSTIIIVSLLVISLFLQIAFRSTSLHDLPMAVIGNAGFAGRAQRGRQAKTPRRFGQVFSRTSRCTTSSSSPDGTRRSRASSGSCARRRGWTWTSWRPCASYGMVAAWTNFLRFENTGATGILPIAIGREPPTAPPPPHTLSASFLP